MENHLETLVQYWHYSYWGAMWVRGKGSQNELHPERQRI